MNTYLAFFINLFCIKECLDTLGLRAQSLLKIDKIMVTGIYCEVMIPNVYRLASDLPLLSRKSRYNVLI